MGAQRLLISRSELAANSLAILPPVETAAPSRPLCIHLALNPHGLAAQDLTINTIGDL